MSVTNTGLIYVIIVKEILFYQYYMLADSDRDALAQVQSINPNVVLPSNVSLALGPIHTHIIITNIVDNLGNTIDTSPFGIVPQVFTGSINIAPTIPLGYALYTAVVRQSVISKFTFQTDVSTLSSVISTLAPTASSYPSGVTATTPVYGDVFIEALINPKSLYLQLT
jgi:hypothetical protein